MCQRVFGIMQVLYKPHHDTCRAAKSLKRSMLFPACTTMTILVQNDKIPTAIRKPVMKSLVQASKPTHTNMVRRQTSGHSPRVLAMTLHSPIDTPPAHRHTRMRAQVPEIRAFLAREGKQVSPLVIADVAPFLFLIIHLLRGSRHEKVDPSKCFNAENILQRRNLRARALACVSKRECVFV